MVWGVCWMMLVRMGKEILPAGGLILEIVKMLIAFAIDGLLAFGS